MKNLLFAITVLFTFPSAAMASGGYKLVPVDKPPVVEQSDWKFRTGARIGYVYAHDSHKPNPKTDEESPLNSPHMFSVGFEMQQTMDGGAWLDVLMIQGVSLTGLDQSVAAPSARALLGFEINDNLQLAVGPNISAHDPSGEGNIIHLIAAIGASVDAGKFNLPLHVAFMPDKNKYNVFALTTGVNW